MALQKQIAAGFWQQRFTYEDWGKGEWGKLGPERVPGGYFSGTNIMVYSTGLIGPRPGFANRTPPSMPGGAFNALMITRVPTREIGFIIGNTVYSSDLFTPTTPTTMGTLDTTPTVVLNPTPDTANYIVAVPGDKCYLLDFQGNAVSGYSASPGGTTAVVYGAQLVVADSTSTSRIFFSDFTTEDFNSWPVDNFLDVGDNWQVTGLFNLRNNLVITKNYGLYIATGVLGFNESVRQISTVQGPLQPFHASVGEDDVLRYIPTFKENPVLFDSTTPQPVGNLNLLSDRRDDTNPTMPAVRGMNTMVGDLTNSDSFAIQNDSDDILLLQHNGIWTKHHTSVSVSGVTATQDDIIFTASTSDAPTQIYSNQFTLDRPGFTSDGFTQPGDDSTTPVDASFELPYNFSALSSEMAVRRVLVEFVKWDTGSSATNHFDITINMLPGFDAPGLIPLATQSFDEVGTSASTEGTPDIKTFKFDRVKGIGFQLSFANIRGCAIRAISVTGENHYNEPRS